MREVYRIDGPSLEQHDTRFEISLLLGGQIKGRRLRLFMVYSAGNFIEATADTPFLQIGEHKYGKPVLDRAVKYETEIYDALKIGLISMDSTMRSNLAVGLPIDILVLRRDTLVPELSYRITAEDHYFSDLRHAGPRRCGKRTSPSRSRPTRPTPSAKRTARKTPLPIFGEGI